MGFMPTDASGAPRGGGDLGSASAAAPAEDRHGLFGLSKTGNDALMAAGFALMGNRSPYLGVAVGNAGLTGLGTYQSEEKSRKAEILSRENMDLKVKQLDKAFDDARQKHELETRKQTEIERANQAREEQGKFNYQPGFGVGPDGKTVPGTYKFDTKKGTQEFLPGVVQSQKQAAEKIPTGFRKTETGDLERIPGGPADPDVIRNTMEAKSKPPAGYRLTENGRMEFVPGGPADPATIKSVSEAKAGNPEAWDDATVKRTASMYNIQGPAALTNIGRGAQSSKVLQQIRAEAARQDEEAGITPAQRAKIQAEYVGQKAAERTLSSQEAKMGTAAFEARGAIELASGAIDKVPRTGFLTFNKLIQGYQNQVLTPAQADLYTYTQGVINAYSAVMSRGSNVVTDASRSHANEMLSTAMNPETYKSVLNAMTQEIDRAINSPDQMRKFYAQKYGPGAVEGQAPPAPVATPRAAAPPTAGPSAPASAPRPQTGGIPTFATPADVAAAVAAGTLHKGDHFISADGKNRMVP
jgi:hypothetical protein